MSKCMQPLPLLVSGNHNIKTRSVELTAPYSHGIQFFVFSNMFNFSAPQS